jgi:cell wall-associated NlpC family hydrolase
VRRPRTIALGAAVCLACAAPVGAAGTPPGLQSRAAQAALAEVGVPYAWNGVAPATGFDTSGLVVWAYGQAGRGGLPHFSGALWDSGRHIARARLRPGDLVFFDDAGHVGIYVGGGRFVHAPGTGRAVRVERLAGSYARAYTGAVRIAARR